MTVVVIVTSFSKNNLTPQQQMRFSQVGEGEGLHSRLILEVKMLGTGWLVLGPSGLQGARFTCYGSHKYLSPLETGARVLEHVRRNLTPKTEQH